MLRKYFQKTKNAGIYFVTSLVIFSFLWMPFDNLFVANAQGFNPPGQYTVGQSSFTSPNGPGIKGYIKGLAPAIAQSPQCKEVIKSKIKSLFKNVKGVISKKAKKKAAETLAQKTKEKAAEAEMIKTFSPNEYQTAQEEYELSKERTEAQAKQLENELCLKSIGRRVALMLLQKITLSTVAWIQSGYEGKPFFLQNPSKFFKDIARNEILQFGAEITAVNPYGKIYLQNLVTAYNTHFQETARYSLNELIKKTTPEYDGVSFSADFSAGGWNAWDALVSVPANNPLGAQLLFSDELARRLEGTSKSTAVRYQEELDQAQGFLGQEICADPEGLTRAQHNAALEAGKMVYKGGGSYIDNDKDGIPDDVDGVIDPPFIGGAPNIVTIKGTPTGYIEGTCRRWEYVTPGHAIAKSMDLVIDYPKNGILEADDLNDAIYLLLDSVIAQATGKLQEGFVSITNEGADGSFITNTYNMDGNYEISQVEKDFAPSQLNSRWLQENPDFNIRTDITQALIDEQRIYAQKLEEQNLEIPGLIMDIRQLDYCIPGPNPNWEETSSVDNFYNNINTRVDLKSFDVASTVLDVALPLVGVGLSSVLGGFDPTAILSGVASAILNDKREDKIKAIYASYIGDLFQVHIYGAGQDDGIEKNGFGDKGHQNQVMDEGDLRDLIDNTWNSYADNIYKIYFNGAKSLAYQAGAMPLVTTEARNEFDKIDGYQKMAEENHEVVQNMKAIVNRLSDIKDEVDALNNTIPDQDSQEYIDGLTPIIAEFSRISNDMVSGNDIADVDNVLKEIRDERDYVWDDLLKGEGGCEKELEKYFWKYEGGPAQNNNYKKFVQREAYPLPVYYFYGTVDPNDAIGWALAQEPWDSKLLKLGNYIAPTEGFLYGMVYYNRHAGPDGPGVSPAPDPDGNMDGDKKPNGDPLNNSDEAEFNIDGDKSPYSGGPGFEIIDDIPVEDTNGDGLLNLTGVEIALDPDKPDDKTMVYDKGNGILGDDIVGAVNHYDCTDKPPFNISVTPFSINPGLIKCDDDPDPYNVNVPFWLPAQLKPSKSGCDKPPFSTTKFCSPNPHGPTGAQWDGPNGLTEISSRMDLCPEYIQFPEDVDDDATDEDGNGAYVEISLPNGIDQNKVPIDIGGLEPRGFGRPDQEGHGPQHANDNGKEYRNICGVIPRAFEKEFNIY